MRKPCVGNSIPEYVLIGLLGIVICVVGIMAVGGNLQKVLAGVKADMLRHQRAAAVAQALQAGGTSFSYQTAGGQTYTVNVGNGSGNGDFSQTTGANGMRMGNGVSLLDAIDLGDSDLTDEQLNLLIKLSNQAHHIGTLADGLEQLSQESGGNLSKFKNLTVTFNGNTYNASDLTAMLAYNQNALQQFITLKQQVLASGLNPKTQAFINSISVEVTASATSLKQTSQQVLKNGGDVGQVTDLGVSDTVNSGAGTICTTGNGTDSGTICTATTSAP